jgi:hypothetical protein
MSKIMRYSSDFVLSLRPSKDQIISEKLSKHFDWINELFLESTQYQDNRKKINYNQINSQKWRTNNTNIVNTIMLMLNGLDSKLYDEIENKLLSIEIKDINRWIAETNPPYVERIESDVIKILYYLFSEATIEYEKNETTIGLRIKWA